VFSEDVAYGLGACLSFFFLRDGLTGGVFINRLSASSKLIGWSETGISSFLRGLDMSNQTPIVSGCWRRDAEALASSSASASCQCRLEDIRILAVVVPPRKFVEVERQILLADIMVGADDSALEQCPERIEVRGVDLAAHILAVRMINGFVRETKRVQVAVSAIFIGRNQFNLVAHSLADKLIERLGAGILDNLANHIALAADRADDANLAGANPASAEMLAFAGVLVLFLAAQKRFINFDLTHKLRESVIAQHRADTMADVEGGLVSGRSAVFFEHPLNLESAHSLLGLTNQVDNLEPDRQGVIGVLEHRANQWREAITVLFIASPDFAGVSVHGLSATLADPIPSAVLYLEYLLITATRAAHALRPAHRDQQFHTSVLSVVLLVNLSKANHKRTLHQPTNGVK
jgi:hypothetical protein